MIEGEEEVGSENLEWFVKSKHRTLESRCSADQRYGHHSQRHPLPSLPAFAD
jgi:hypothetical protein